jgi:mono/diheme cytochrome c family protein
MISTLAWRMIPPPKGGDGATVVHQRASRVIDNVTAVAAYYSGEDCNGSLRLPQVAAAVTGFYDSEPETIAIPTAVLPVDVAVNPSATTYAVVAAGNGHTSGMDSLFTFSSRRVSPGSSDCVDQTESHHINGQLTSVAFRNDNELVLFQREPARIYVIQATDAEADLKAINIDAPSAEDTGHAVFHSNTGTGIACASCHAEGGDDGLVWSFAKQGRRRTPSLKGTLDGTAPYHWDGDLSNVPALVQRVYITGMAGPELMPPQEEALQNFLFAIPRPAVAPPTDTAAVARGKALFEGQGGCTSCHAGPKFTNNSNAVVGTGGSFQVPSLIGVAARAPYLHTGCGVTLADRFDPACGGGAQHGATAGLGTNDIPDLVAYLSTL